MVNARIPFSLKHAAHRFFLLEIIFECPKQFRQVFSQKEGMRKYSHNRRLLAFDQFYMHFSPSGPIKLTKINSLPRAEKQISAFNDHIQ